MMFFAYIFSFTMRMIWVWQLQDNPNFYWNDQLMINTNDGYTWAAGAQNILYGMHEYNSGIRDMWANGIIFFTVLFTKVTPFSLETIILYMPAMISSLVVIPIILISRLYGEAIWGFFAALLGAIAWSYYNRTMIGYYDTDMFSAMAPMFILYFLMKSTMDFTPRSALYAAIAIALYPFLYDAGKSIVYAMGIIYALYMMFYHRHDRTTYISMVLVFVALVPFPLVAPFNYLIKIVVLIGLYFVLKRSSVEQKKLMFISAILFLLFMYFGNVFGLILGKVMSYVSTGTAKEGLHFYGVHQTIREAGKIPFETFANRISGSQIGVIVSFIGYIVLVVRHKAFILALPLIGIGAFALWGGLRFTVYAVPIAAMSAIYLFHIITTTISDKKSIYVVGMTLLTGSMLYPNITHIIEYKVPTVFNKAEVEDLVKLDAISKPKDYTLTWWDYGYPIWFYSSTNTIIDGGKHQNDNFIISKIMQTSSSDLAANLSRLAVETYVESNYANIANTIFKNRQEDQLDPNLLLSELASGTYTLPKKTRDIYLYLPYRMMRIFPTVAVFGNLDLTTGQEERKVAFYPTQAVSNKEGTIAFNNGIMFDTKKGVVRLGNKEVAVKYFVVTQHTKEGKLQKQSQVYHADGEYVVVYMQSYGQFVIMDKETFNSMYVQMFMLETYDKDLFELVVSSPYSKIYKLKI
ncbi:STT3 domain-containing protein [Sulfurovum sp. TSL1]|uniref:STT3 domain-containing protein n=1 Tax=Sulfurovum sp. TSL1 TaxID=2826994 RepID=UPI001CC7D497|nr:STT3 domain-containing protein [Sulfurovum sp. TSL1]